MELKRTSKSLETMALWFITQNKSASFQLFSQLNEEHFGSKANAAAFKRLRFVNKTKNILMSFDDLKEDTAIPEASRLIFDAWEKTTLVTKQRANEIYDRLEDYRKKRVMYDGLKKITEEQLLQNLNIDEVVNNIVQLTGKARSPDSNDEYFITGRGGNTDEIVKRVLSRGIPVIPTGISTWDDVNGGIPMNSVVLLGADTSGGKSLMADCLAENFVDYGAKTAFVSLEMDIEELTVRRLSRISSIDQGKIFSPDKLSEKEKKQITEAHNERNKRWDKQGKSLYTRVPKGNPTIEELLLRLQPHDFKVIIIDYISLLSGTSGDDQWRRLGDVVAYCKSFCRNNGCSIVLLVQITKEQKLKYSSTMLEHADLAWFWVKDQTVLETGVVTVNVPKARKQKAFTFQLKAEYEYARFVDLPADYKPPEVSDLINKELKNIAKNDNRKPKTQNEKLMQEFFPSKKKAA